MMWWWIVWGSKPVGLAGNDDDLRSVLTGFKVNGRPAGHGLELDAAFAQGQNPPARPSESARRWR